MNKFTIRIYLPLLAIMMGLSMISCQQEFDEYYARPSNLAGPVYQVLSDSARFQGNFDHYLALVERAGYKETLSSAGYWTVFAPDDSAYEAYFLEKGISGVQDIDDETAFKLVAYSLVFDAYDLNTLAFYQTGPGNDTLSSSFRRKTAYYTGVTRRNVYGEEMEVIGANRNGIGTFSINDNNNKHVPYFLNHYLRQKDITAQDIEAFYNRTFSGAQVDRANIAISNVRAENGVIHVLDRVIEPLQNIEEYLASKPEYSLFKSIVEMDYRNRANNVAVNYDSESYPQLTERYGALQQLMGPVHVKSYSGQYAFAPNNENFLRANVNDAQSDSWTLFAPENAALQQFLDDILLENYGAVSNVPDEIMFDFVNMHMFQSAVWPSKLRENSNALGEPARFDLESNITDKKVLSNGLFYGTNRVQEGNFFFSVYGKPYLNPAYSIMRTLLGPYRFTISSPGQNFGLIMMSNQQIVDAGFEYNPGTPTEWTFNGSGNLAFDRISRMLELSLIQIDNPSELADLNTPKIFETFGGEYIRIENNQIYASGNADEGVTLNFDVAQSHLANNGYVLYVNGLLKYTEKTLAQSIFDTPQFSRFSDYLRGSSLYNSGTLQIEGVGSGAFFTVLAPSNDAIEQAVLDGKLPADPFTGNVEERERIATFLKYHFIPRNTIVPDGKKIVNPAGEEFNTLFVTLEGEAQKVVIDNSANGNNPPFTMTVRDNQGNVANVILPQSNVLASRAVIHLLDRVLEY
ncbi:fasciclin domain-containing protein [Belliella sp. DSM 107340]|uniref:Fasciclin domain-containing protein n=1 Tax=Belliella calami TaxID=2923436 RepID=A0ABS9UQF8_9BACT|nr:fasciclin domain-containing protein [Belliella calami]MCH7398868.1 fasciclin domain-containing protein [Belliella calami]